MHPSPFAASPIDLPVAVVEECLVRTNHMSVGLFLQCVHIALTGNPCFMVGIRGGVFCGGDCRKNLEQCFDGTALIFRSY